VVSATLRHDRRHVNAADRFRATTVSLPQSRDQRARMTSLQRIGRQIICHLWSKTVIRMTHAPETGAD